MATRMQRNTQQQRGGMRGGGVRGRIQSAVSGRRQSRRQMGDGQKFGVDNLTYDLVTILHEKSKGLEAIGKYMEDAQDNEEVMDLIQRIQQQDRKMVQELRNCLADVIRGNANEM